MALLASAATLLWLAGAGRALDNGLALTPPMGWLTWERYRCITDCRLYPDECISERMIKKVVDLMVSEGYKEAGYSYVGIDDCWMERQRDARGNLVADKERFPSGMKALGDYIHAAGLKFALYEDIGTMTCQAFPGVRGHEAADAASFAAWGVDYVKLDGCHIASADIDTGYPAFGKLLNESGRPMLYSCSWPAYQAQPNYPAIAEACNIWRNWDDIDDSWQSVLNITDWFGHNQAQFAHLAGPGRFNDPDMLIIGNFGLSPTQAEVQMALWAVLAAPLMISADLASMAPEYKRILLNKDVIAVNQDPLGKQGLRHTQHRDGTEAWSRPLSRGHFAAAFLSRRIDGAPHAARFSQAAAGLPPADYRAQNLFRNTEEFVWKANDTLTVRIKPTGVEFFRLWPAHGAKKNVNLDTNNDLNETYK